MKGVLANWLVCLAAYMASLESDLAGKILGLWPCISGFVLMGFEHSVRPWPPAARSCAYRCAHAARLASVLNQGAPGPSLLHSDAPRGSLAPLAPAHARTCAPQIANHFLLPLGQMAGADISVMDMLMKNVLPVTVGNILAGAVVFAASYSFLFGALGGHKKD